MAEKLENLQTILIVDDTPDNLVLLEAVLGGEYIIITAASGIEALGIANEKQPDLILLDIMMPGMSGYDVCGRLKETPQLRDIPVIFLSILESTEDKVKAFKTGAVDYITKPFHGDEVKARVKTHLMMSKLQFELELQNEVLELTVAELNRLAMIVESSDDAIFTVSTDNIITSWNRGAENLFGYPSREILGSPIFTIMPAERCQDKSHIWQTILSGEKQQYFKTNRNRKDADQIYVSIKASPLLNAEWKIVGNSVIACDVTERRKMEEVIKHQAHHDTMTDLPNRQLFIDLLTHELAQARRHDKKLALLFLDLNGFKKVNDTFGHSCGDRLLQEVARRLKAGIRESDTVARLGGDEFTILMPDIDQADDVSIVLEKIVAVFEIPFVLDGVTIESSTSIGVSMFPDDGDNCDDLMKKADSAMYIAKESGKNSYQFYNVKINAHKKECPCAHE